jgi:hypothetical protein
VGRRKESNAAKEPGNPHGNLEIFFMQNEQKLGDILVYPLWGWGQVIRPTVEANLYLLGSNKQTAAWPGRAVSAFRFPFFFSLFYHWASLLARDDNKI